ncbi:MAG: hypothetical protein U9Q83_06415, partial [Bacteroidota bacterium]|nr:hypothetical protein [Bacteroidota bacterium]
VGESSGLPQISSGKITTNKNNNIFVENGVYCFHIDTSKTSFVTWNIDSPKYYPNAQNVGIFLNFDDSSKIEQVIIEIYSSQTNKWVRSTKSFNMNTSLQNEWQLFRWRVKDSNTKDFGIHTTKIRLIFKSNAPTKLKIGYIFAETPAKSKLLFIQDGGYSKGWISENLAEGQNQSGIDDCKQHNLPITWALTPDRVINNNSNNVISLEKLKKMQKDSINFWSFHGYDAQILASKTTNEIKNNIRKTLSWLTKNNFGEVHFRAAHMQNNAPAARNTKNYLGLKALATYSQKTGGFETFPFTNRWDINRCAIHNLSKKDIDKKFNILKERRCLIVTYTHKIVSDNSASIVDIKVSLWQYFLSKINTAVSEGWLELVSYDELENELRQYNIDDNDISISKALLKELQFISKNN